MKRIPLTRGYYALVDDEDFDYLNRWKWFSSVAQTGCVYARRNEGVGNGKQVTVLMHRVIARTPDNLVVDHINGDGLDNRKQNLRSVDKIVNCQNRTRMNRNNTSGHRGIYLSRNKRSPSSYLVLVQKDKVMHRGGFHKTLEEAIKARDAIKKSLT